MSKIEQLISEIEEYLDTCKLSPLSSTKIIVNKEEMMELLVELRMRVPDEIKQYQKIISNQEAILNEAKTQADQMVAEAKQQSDQMISQAAQQTDELVNEHEILQRANAAANEVISQANEQAQSIVDAAVNDANNIRQGAISYTDGILKKLQDIIAYTMDGEKGRYDAFSSAMQSCMDIVTSNRNELSGTATAGDTQEAAVTE